MSVTQNSTEAIAAMRQKYIERHGVNTCPDDATMLAMFSAGMQALREADAREPRR